MFAASLMAGRRLSLKQQLRSRCPKISKNVTFDKITIQKYNTMATYVSTLAMFYNTNRKFRFYEIWCQICLLKAIFEFLSATAFHSIQSVFQMLGGPNDGQPPLRPKRPPCRGRHRSAWPPRGLSWSCPWPSWPRHCGDLGEGVEEPSHHDTGWLRDNSDPWTHLLQHRHTNTGEKPSYDWFTNIPIYLTGEEVYLYNIS